MRGGIYVTIPPNQVKYMQLAAQSSFKGKSDRSKYNKATKLCGNIDKIRADYKKNLKSKSLEVRQIDTGHGNYVGD
jgi:DNA topoisomerase-1